MKNKIIFHWIKVNVINSMVVCFSIFIFIVLVQINIKHMLIIDNIWYNTISLMLFQPMIISNKLIDMHLTFVIIIWGIIIYLTNKKIFFEYNNFKLVANEKSKLNYFLDKNKQLMFYDIIEITIKSCIFLIFSLSISLIIKHSVNYSIINSVFIFFLLQSCVYLMKRKSFKHILMLGPMIIIILSIIFGIFFEIIASLPNIIGFFIFLPNIIAMNILITFGANINVILGNRIITLNPFSYYNKNISFYNDFKILLPYFTITFIIGTLLLLLISIITNPNNKLKNQLINTLYLNIILILISMISKISFYVPFLGVIIITSNIKNIIIIISFIMFSIYIIRYIFYKIKILI